jgi:hypothetical protein
MGNPYKDSMAQGGKQFRPVNPPIRAQNSDWIQNNSIFLLKKSIFSEICYKYL